MTQTPDITPENVERFHAVTSLISDHITFCSEHGLAKISEAELAGKDLISLVRASDYDALSARLAEVEASLLSATMDGYDMAKHEYRDRIKELEAKRVKAVNLIVFLDENYIHAFGDTARQKIRELYAELTSTCCLGLPDAECANVPSDQCAGRGAKGESDE
jgi:hypothetical protein